ncbi:MAG TPA: response regulator [Terriglobales bacterium]|nr:response regulator [Terriglobales bacterium]
MFSQTILCVHDTAGELQELRGALENAGYQVVPAIDGSQAMSILKAGGVDGVILDYDTEAPGGVTLRNSITHAFPELPLLLFSHVEEIKRTPLRMFEAFLNRPEPLDSVISRIPTNC